MKKKREILYFFFLLFFSISINQYYGNIGVYPIDSFIHYDSGYRTLNGYFPIKDFWINNGFLIDLIQAIFFKVFGISWFSYVLHASIFNFLIVSATFFTLIKFNLNVHISFFYSLLVAVIAYPTSGTPFLDHHSMILSLIALFSFILSLKEKSNIYWFTTPIFIALAFLSKQVPAAYIGLIIIIFSIIYFFYYFDIKKIFIFFLGSITITALSLLFLLVNDINLYSFYQQIFLSPLTIGGDRFQNFILPLEFNRIVLRFKLIHLSQIILIFIIVKRVIENLNYFKNAEFFILISIVFTSFSLIAHQLLTLNQKFIFFIIPILLGFSHIYYKKYFTYNIVVFCILILFGSASTIYYKFNYVDNRKFMELETVDLKRSLDASILDKKLKNLKWISPIFPENPLKEIKLLKESIKIINNDEREKMLITHYQFMANIINDYVYSPSRLYTGNGVDYPLIDNKNFYIYKEFFLNQIVKNNIEIIYTIKPIDGYIYLNILDDICVEVKKENEILFSHLILNCKELN